MAEVQYASAASIRRVDDTAGIDGRHHRNAQLWTAHLSPHLFFNLALPHQAAQLKKGETLC
jgi:hypothetical protein